MGKKKIKETQLDLFDMDAMSVDQVIDQLGPDQRGDTRMWPATLAELIDVLTDHFQDRMGVDPCDAIAQAQDVILVLSHHMGRRAWYIPGDDKIRRAVRDAAIYKAFNGSNHVELAKKAGLTTAQIYNIISAQRRLRDEKQQGTLFLGY